MLGGGAAGLMCALTAGQRGKRVLVLERANKLGKKIIMSGGGRCNFTNLHVQPDRYLSENPHFCKSALSRYTQWHFIEMVERHQIAYHEKETVNGLSGQLFCDASSKQIVAMLLAECESAGVHIQTQVETTAVTRGNGKYIVATEKQELQAEVVVLATGGLSIPKLGGSRFGYDIASELGMELLPLRAGLVPFTLTDQNQQLAQSLAGVSTHVEATCNDQSFREQMLFTHRGLSGPAMLQISSYWHPGDRLNINLLRSVAADFAAAQAWAFNQKDTQPGARLSKVLEPVLPKGLRQELAELFWSDATDKPLAEWSNSHLATVIDRLVHWQIKPAGTEGYRTAEVTLGGVSTDAVSSKSFECHDHPGLFIIGELLDVTGHLGGFNFQWAWSSGWAAGMAM